MQTKYRELLSKIISTEKKKFSVTRYNILYDGTYYRCLRSTFVLAPHGDETRQ